MWILFEVVSGSTSLRTSSDVSQKQPQPPDLAKAQRIDPTSGVVDNEWGANYLHSPKTVESRLDLYLLVEFCST